MGNLKKNIQLITIIIALAGCSGASKLRRAEKLIKKAELQGATWRSDTVWAERVVIRPEIRVDTLIVAEPGDTVVISKDRLKLKYVRLAGDTVFIDAACLPDTVKVKVPVNVYRDIHVKAFWKWWHVLISFGIGAIFGRLVIRLLI